MSKISIIIAEDDPRNAEILNRFISRLSYFQVDGIAETLLQAKDLFEVIQPDLIILDHYFPDGKGTELLQQIREEKSHTDVIMITAAKDVDTIRNALHGGVFDYLIKPISYQRLEKSMKKYQDYYYRMHNLDNMQQHDVDKLLQLNPNSTPSSAPRLPKGIDSLTLNKIKIHLKECPKHITAEKLGLSLKISRTTARRYLEYLVSLNELTADVTYGGVGRPERIYKLNIR